MENKVIVVKDGRQKPYSLPRHGTITIQIQDGKVIHVERSEKEKI